MSPLIKLSSKLWEMTICGLATRSQRIRESGCIWAGERNSSTWIASEILFLDDLPGVSRERLYHRTSRDATNKLFEILREKKLQIIADLHTHPDDWVELSETDKMHPIEFKIGLMQIIFPFFAAKAVVLDKIGFHEYLGNYEWKRLSTSEVQKKINIGNLQNE